MLRFSTLTLEIPTPPRLPMDIITPLHVLRQGLDATPLKRLGVLVQTMLTMTGRITMLGLVPVG
jgi:hypothetical protein